MVRLRLVFVVIFICFTINSYMEIKNLQNLQSMHNVPKIPGEQSVAVRVYKPQDDRPPMFQRALEILKNGYMVMKTLLKSNLERDNAKLRRPNEGHRTGKSEIGYGHLRDLIGKDDSNSRYGYNRSKSWVYYAAAY